MIDVSCLHETGTYQTHFSGMTKPPGKCAFMKAIPLFPVVNAYCKCKGKG
jgi:hypothetical protein